jgi:hypothetical protein
MEKLDGSTLIVSTYKGELIVRTRGTADATQLDNGKEIDELMAKYPKAFEFEGSYEDEDGTSMYSRIFEWCSPVNRIVIRHDELHMKLIGAIWHSDYSLTSQKELDDLAESIEVERPRTYDFDSVDDLKDAVEAFKGVEGICLYSKKGQVIHKVKGADYLARHRLKDSMRTFEHVLDYFFKEDCPSYNDFYSSVETNIDWETAEEIRGDISKCVDGYKEVLKILEHMRTVVEPLREEQRRTAANIVKQKYGNTNRCAYAFRLLDGKKLENDMLKKLMFQVVKQ